MLYELEIPPCLTGEELKNTLLSIFDESVMYLRSIKNEKALEIYEQATYTLMQMSDEEVSDFIWSIYDMDEYRDEDLLFDHLYCDFLVDENMDLKNNPLLQLK